MASEPKTLFESFESFLDQDFSSEGSSIAFVSTYIDGFDSELAAQSGYRSVRSFLLSYKGSEQTFNSYRTHVERLLLWSLIIRIKSILLLKAGC